MTLKHMGLSKNLWNPNKDRIQTIDYVQNDDDLKGMAEFIEEQDGMTTHLAGEIIMQLSGVIRDPGTTYQEVSGVSYDKITDETTIVVADPNHGTITITLRFTPNTTSS